MMAPPEDDLPDFDEETETAEQKETKVIQYFIHATTNAIKPCEEKKDFALAIDVEAILARREKKKEKTKEYQCKLRGKSVEDAIWIEKTILIKMGHLTKVQRQDEKEAMAAGLTTKLLTSEGVEKHLKDFGLDAEVASHTTIQSLSGGQKVKVVLGASMWQNPHILVLDEPTNYLDRDGLGALTKAINEWNGGVIIISHNREFCGAVATEKWIMQAGQLRQEGSSEERVAKEEETGSGNKEEKELFDASGNKIDVKENEEKSNKELKKQIKQVEKELKDGKKKKTLTEEEIWELEDKLLALNEKLAAQK